jgi:hypothetical protein
LYSEHLVIAQRTDEHGVSSGAATAEANVPLSFAPGEKYQFDWSHEVVLINGTMVTVKVAPSGCVLAEWFVRANPCETQEMVFGAHNRVFLLQGDLYARHLRQSRDASAAR